MLSVLWLPVFLFVVNQQGCEVDHSPLSNAEDRNEWNCTPTPPICLHIVDGETFTLSIYPLFEAVKLSGAVVSTGKVFSK
jgi:hypothetical protein